MTTIAWDGKTLAGDTQATRACLINHCESKVFRVRVHSSDRTVLLGVSGSEGPSMRVLEWIKRGMPEEQRPKLSEDSFNGILITGEGAFRLDSDLFPLKLMEPFHAIGSGREFATAAMHLGFDARRAVEVASLYDIYSSGPITSVTLEG